MTPLVNRLVFRIESQFTIDRGESGGFAAVENVAFPPFAAIVLLSKITVLSNNVFSLELKFDTSDIRSRLLLYHVKYLMKFGVLYTATQPQQRV